jgi:hypothetical protein
MSRYVYLNRQQNEPVFVPCGVEFNTFKYDAINHALPLLPPFCEPDNINADGTKSLFPEEPL